MNTWLVTDLKAGMRFSQSVFVDGNNILVPALLPLKDKDIQRLIKWNIIAVSSEGELVPDETTAESGTIAVNPQSKEALSRIAFIGTSSKEVMDEYSNLGTKLSELYKRIKENDLVDEHEIAVIIDLAIKLMFDRRNDTIQYILFGLQGESTYVENGLNSTFLSILIGMNLNLPRHKLTNLASGSLLHDVGNMRIPEEILAKKESLSSAELQQIKTHPLHSYRIITKEIKMPEEVGLTALQHHERWDGQGYPKGLKGKDISLYARIVAVADAFEAMVSERPYRDSMIGYTAMRTILSDNGRRFDPEILKVFIKSLGIYPIGSIVLLSDASIGRVIENHPDAPLRPKIRTMIDSLGTAYLNDEGSVINLLEDKSVFIARAVNPKELSARTVKD